MYNNEDDDVRGSDDKNINLQQWSKFNQISQTSNKPTFFPLINAFMSLYVEQSHLFYI